MICMAAVQVSKKSQTLFAKVESPNPYFMYSVAAPYSKPRL